MRPAVGGADVVSIRIRVVLPAPFGPSSQVTPGYNSRSTESSATVAPYRLVRPFVVATGGVLTHNLRERRPTPQSSADDAPTRRILPGRQTPDGNPTAGAP